MTRAQSTLVCAVVCGLGCGDANRPPLLAAGGSTSQGGGSMGGGSAATSMKDAGWDARPMAPTGCVPPLAGAPPDEPFRRARTAAELPDDAEGEYQIHVLYVEPSDRRAVARLDEDGSIRRSVTAWNAWFAARTGGARLRVDTCGGVLDVTYVELAAPFTEAAMAQGTLEPNGPAFLRDRLEAELKKTFADPKKIYLVYYDGLAFGHCGGAPLPPSLLGQFPVLQLGGLFQATFLASAAPAGATSLGVYDPVAAGLSATGAFSAHLGTESVSVVSVLGTTVTLAEPLASQHPAGEILLADERPPDCRSNPFSSNGVALGYTDYSAVHEILHTLGIVGSGAQHYSAWAAPGHLTEASRGGTADVMYQGSAPWACSGPIHESPALSPCVLDPAHENYWALPPEVAAIDLSRSAFLDPTPANAETPPGW